MMVNTISGAIFFHLFTSLGVLHVVDAAGDTDRGALFAMAYGIWVCCVVKLTLDWRARSSPQRWRRPEEHAMNPSPLAMRRRLQRARFATALLTAPLGNISADETKDLKKDAEGIQVLTQAVEGSKFKAVRATMTVETSVSGLVALVRDTSACAEWVYLCITSKEHRVVSETEMYIYTHNDLPWPVSDRDALFHVVWEQAADSSVTMTARAVGDSDINKKRGVVRLKDALTNWTFNPVEGGVEVVFDAHVDPGGPLPAFVTNMLLIDAPFHTLTRMRALALSGRYDNAHFDFLKAK